MTEKLPTETKRLKGTFRQSRERGGIEAGARLAEVPLPPETLSSGAMGEWNWLAPVLVELEVLTRADLRTLALCCETLSTATELETTIRDEGYTIPASTGGRKSHPALKALETSRNAGLRMLNDFGLSPKSRKFVTKAPGPAKDNPWANLDRDRRTPEEKAADYKWAKAMSKKYKAFKDPDETSPYEEKENGD
jgi:P27 family predicted phage terminase small subunit